MLKILKSVTEYSNFFKNKGIQLVQLLFSVNRLTFINFLQDLRRVLVKRCLSHLTNSFLKKIKEINDLVKLRL